MTFQHVKVEIAHVGMVNCVEVGNLGEQWTGVLCQWMQGYSIGEKANVLSAMSYEQRRLCLCISLQEYLHRDQM